ncbi:MAG: DUF2207 domain-containing protein [Bacillota bacterium]
MGSRIARILGRANPAIIAGLVILILLVAAPGRVAARSHSFPAVDIEARLTEDGSLVVTENRTVSFDGSFSGMYMWIREPDPTRVEAVQVREGDREYRENPGDSPGPAGTFFTRREGDSLYIDWSFEARDESRTFSVDYSIANAVRVHRDVAEIYHQFIGDEWDMPVKRATVTLILPGDVPRDSIRAWGHGPLHGEVEITDDGRILWEVQPLPANTFLEGRVTFPPDAVPAATVRTDREELPEILAEERQWAGEANRARWADRLQWFLAPLLAVGGAVLALYFWWKYGKEFRPDFSGDYYRELPADYSPAELGVLWRFGTPNTDDFTATIMDLARRGWLRLEEYERTRRNFLWTTTTDDFRAVRSSGDDELKDHERSVLDFLFRLAADGGDEIGFADLKEYIEGNKQRAAKFWKSWMADLSARGDVLGFFDADTKRAQVLEIVVGTVAVVSGVAIAIFGYPIVGFGSIAGGIFPILGGAMLRRRSKRGVEDFVRWRAFRRFLAHFSEMERRTVPSLIIWEHYLVYAVTLGVAKEVLRQLETVFPDLQEGSHQFGAGWLYLSSARGASAGVSGLSGSLTNLTHSLQTSIKSAMSPVSSGSGGGGGFSGGGGGGFSGGGGGGVR